MTRPRWMNWSARSPKSHFCQCLKSLVMLPQYCSIGLGCTWDIPWWRHEDVTLHKPKLKAQDKNRAWWASVAATDSGLIDRRARQTTRQGIASLCHVGKVTGGKSAAQSLISHHFWGKFWKHSNLFYSYFSPSAQLSKAVMGGWNRVHCNTIHV